ncbi:vitamin K epoxide reductase family protein [Candidatus Woesearchaeota archaeon]|jgi:uncharacterized membrane protein|nr:vitamin K epoxide reductase family protein [Candidatus Woesearchaeota archaeon]MBT5215877.1 vitamin K epoxide reductase family protein [Candidatus Woesearchaeota archaeon]MBT6401898.1 vitamin K epoxide reductase family protein [Candidatus Woesearchaeota archaeon]
MNKRILGIRIIAVLAIIVSGVLVNAHYKVEPSTLCVIGDNFDCDIVNKSPYSTIDGIFYFINSDLGINFPELYFPLPVSAISILMFGAIILLTIKPKIKVLKTLMVLSILFSLYLIYIEAFILLAYCIYCIILDILIILETILIWGIKE